MTTVPRRFEMAPWMDEPAEAWRSEVALEMWVDAQGRQPVVYLAGTLTDETGANVAAVVRGLVMEGHSQVVVDVGCLTLENGWFGILCGLQKEARRAGGSLAWSFASNGDVGPALSGLEFWVRPGKTVVTPRD